MEQMGLSFGIGVGGGFLMVWLANRLELTGGLYPILAFAMALLIFAGTQTIGEQRFPRRLPGGHSVRQPARARATADGEQ